MPELNWAHEPLSEDLQSFKARMTLYLEDKEVTDTTKQATKIKIAIGDEGIHRVLASGRSEEEQKVPENIWTLVEEQLDASTHINYQVHHLELSNMLQKPDQVLPARGIFCLHLAGGQALSLSPDSVITESGLKLSACPPAKCRQKIPQAGKIISKPALLAVSF